MFTFRRTFIPNLALGKPINKARSLCWLGNDLVDWAGGGTRYCPDGTVHQARVIMAFGFDCAVSSADGVYSAIFVRLGTKGLVLKNGSVLREINRSFYFAESYEYPVAFLELPNGRTALIHCPDNYCRLEIEDAETGERLTRRDADQADFFHSRLAVSPDRRHFISAGWRWHPFNDVIIFDVNEILNDATKLDRNDHEHRLAQYGKGVEIASAVFQEPGRLAVATAHECDDPDYQDDDERDLLGPGMIGVYNILGRRFISTASLKEPAGTIMPVGERHAVSFYRHPKVIELSTGKVVQRWPDLNSGEQLSSIIRHQELSPPIAMDARNRRFAIASDDGVTVIQVDDEVSATE
ncbi:MAG: hypothetical protein ACKVOI_13665 [Dongiaceae bacterium]